jgi:RNA polymerase sigma-70 factor (ECF subfamily)
MDIGIDRVWTSLCGYVPGIQRYARAIARNPADVDDLVQECLTRALSQRHVWPGVKDVRAYLFTILHNVHVDQVNRRGREGQAVPLDDSVCMLLACAPSQDDQLMLRDLVRSLACLPRERRDVLLCIAVDGMSYQQVADEFGVPIGTVMSRLSRARAALRELMAGGGAALVARDSAPWIDHNAAEHDPASAGNNPWPVRSVTGDPLLRGSSGMTVS